MNKKVGHKAVKEYPVELFCNKYVARVYVLFSPLRLVLSLDLERPKPQDGLPPLLVHVS